MSSSEVLRFQAYAIEVKLDKLSPLRGFKRMFGLQALVELVKSIAKVLVIGCVVALLFM